VKLGATESIKFKKLKMRLKLSHWQAVGLLESLWMFTSRNSPLGDIGRHSDEDIAAAIEWPEEPSSLILALVECRWLDSSEEHRLVVHDWVDHMPNWLKGNIAAAKTKKKVPQEASKERPKEPPKDGAKDHPKEASADGSSYSYHSIPYQVIPSKEKIQEQTHDPHAVSKTPYADNAREGFFTTPPIDFERFWKAYPRKIQKRNAALHWEAAVASVECENGVSSTVAIEWLISKARELAASKLARGDPQFVPGAFAFLKDERFFDDPNEWNKANGSNAGGRNFAEKPSGRFTGSEVDNDLAGLVIVGGKTD
jgi:hypothetical protein